MTIYDHIEENNVRTVLLVLAFLGLIMSLAFLSVWVAAGLTYDPEVHYSVQDLTQKIALKYLPFVFIAGLLWLLVSYLSGDEIMLSSSGAKEISRHDFPEIYSLVENTAITAGLPMPRVFLIEDNSANAFATGRSPSKASIAFTTGIVSLLDRSELEGVCAHEMSHIGNRDIRLMLLTVTGIGILTLLGQLMLRMTFLSSGSGNRNRRSDGRVQLIFMALGLLFLVYGFLILPLVQYALSRNREFQADATAALLTRNPRALASALAKISRDSRVESLDSLPLMSAMCIEDASAARDGKGAGCFAMLMGLGATHPPVEDRIARLEDM